MSDKARNIYDKIINSKVASVEELGTQEMFTQYVSSPDNASKIYQKLLSKGLSEVELGTQDMFVSAIVPKSSVDVKASTAQSPSATITNTGIKSQEQTNSNESSAKKQGGEKEDWWIQDLGDKLNQGSANIFGGVLGWLGEGEDLINKGISSAATAITGKEYAQPQTGWFAQAANYFKQDAERSRQAVNRFDGKSIGEQFDDKEYGALASQLLLEGASSLPTSIGMMVAPQVFVPTTIASSSNLKYDELKEREDLSTTAKLTNAVTTGIIEAATERLGSIPVGGWLKSLYFKGAETGTKVFKKTLMDEITKLYKRYGLLLAPVGEGVEEAVGRAGENFTDWVTGVTNKLNLAKGTAEAFLFGVGGATYFTALGVPGTIRNEVQRNKIETNTKRHLNEVLSYTKEGGLAEDIVKRVVSNSKNNTIEKTLEGTENAIQLIKEENGFEDADLFDIREKLLATVYGTRKLHQYYDRQSDAELLLDYYKDKAKNDIINLADEDGNITKVTLSDGRVVDVVSGRVKVNENGKINFEESSPTLIVADKSGKRIPVQTNGSALRVESLVPQTPAQQEVENVTNTLQQKYEMETKYPIGTVVYVTDEQGNIKQNEDGTNQSSTIKDHSEDGVIIDTDQGEINLPFALAKNSLLTESDVKERLHTTFTPDTEVKSGNGEGFLYIKGIKDAVSNTYEVSMYDNNREFVDTVEMSGKDIYEFGKNKMTEISTQNEDIQPVEDSKMTEEGEFEQKIEQITFPTKKEGGYDFTQFTPEHHYLFAAKTEGDKVANQDLKTAVYAALGNIQKQQDKINKAPFEKKAALRAELLLIKSKYNDLKALEDKYIPKEEAKQGEIEDIPTQQKASEQSEETQAPVINEQINKQAIHVTENVKQRKQKKLNKTQQQASEIEISPSDIRANVMMYFINGGKINKSVLQQIFGSKGQNAKSIESERRFRISMLTKNENTIDSVSHQIWEDMDGYERGIDTSDIRNELEYVISSYNSPVQIAKDLIESYKEKEQQVPDDLSVTDDIMTSDYESEFAEEAIKEIYDLCDDDQINAIFSDTYFHNEDGSINFEKLLSSLETDKGFFTNFPYELSEEQYQNIINIIRQNYDNTKTDIGRVQEKTETNNNSQSDSEGNNGIRGTGSNETRNSEQPLKESKQTSKEDKRTSDEKELDESILSQAHNNNPTEKQKETGVYDKARINVQGYNITLETLKGQERKGIDNNGKAWAITMNNHYGELDSTIGYDGDAIDVFIGPNPKQGQIFVIDQLSNNGTFDESKVMLGFDTAEEAKAAYMSNYEEGWQGFGSITPAGDNFKQWLYDGKKQRKPFAEYKETPNAVDVSEPTQLATANTELATAKAKYDKAYNKYLDLKNKLEKDPAFGMGGQTDIFGNVSGSDYLFGNDGQKQAVEAVQAAKKQSDDLKLSVDELQAKVDRLKEAAQDKVRGQQEMKFEDEKSAQQPKEVDVAGVFNSLNKKGIAKFSEHTVSDKVSTAQAKQPLSVEEQEIVDTDSKIQNIVEQPKITATDEKIEDVGQKIGGAKKDLFQEYAKKLLSVTDQDIAKLPLSKSFPRPNFAQLIEDGKMTQETAIFLNYFYDNIPSKPQKSYKVERWVKTVRGALDTFNSVLERKPTRDLMQEYIDMLNTNIVGQREAFNAEVYRAVRKAINFPNNDVNVGNLTILRSRTVENAYVYSVGNPIGNRVKLTGRFNTMEEAAAKLIEMAKETAGKPKQIEFSVYSSRSRGDFYITPKGKGEIVLQNGFKTSKEAFEYINENREALTDRFNAMKEIPSERRMSNRERVGFDYRQGKNVTAEDFKKEFGFRGVEFGNWVNQEERQAHINEAYDALIDLASVIGVTPRALSLNGELGFAFGSRGGGKYAAHYETNKVVINLTKTKGAGTLAHEWFHALDNYLLRAVGNRTSYATDGPGFNKEGKPALRPELNDAFRNLMKVIRKSGFYTRSAKLDKVKGSKYWGTSVELGARGFEDFVMNKLAKSNIQNDYLVNFKSLAEFIDRVNGDISEITSKYPYPTMEESETISEAYQNLFDTIQEDDNAVLFQIIGERGAESLDASEEATTRLDNLRVAKEMEADTKTPQEIRMATGWERGVDGLWRYEIPDIKTINKEVFNSLHGGETYNTVKLQELIGEDNELLKSYPQLKGIDVARNSINAGGIYSSSGNGQITINEKLTSISAKSTLIHEIQHAIQEIEGFAKGGGIGTAATELSEVNEEKKKQLDVISKDIETILNKLKWYDESWNERIKTESGYNDLVEKAKVIKNELLNEKLITDYNKYWNLAGETEARNASARMNFTPDERRQRLLSETADVAPEDQIILMDSVGISQHTGTTMQPTTPEEVLALVQHLFKTGVAKEYRFVDDAEIQAEIEGNEQLHAVYHGSPHSFDQFSLDHIGTGEGAQAYGWGLYFTDKKDIAKDYAEQISRRFIKEMYESGEEMPEKAYEALNAVDFLGFDNEWQAANEFYRLPKKKVLSNWDITEQEYNTINDSLLENKRNLYAVELHEGKDPSEYDYLRWDKEITPIQLEKIQSLYQKQTNNPIEIQGDLENNNEIVTGESAYAALRWLLSDNALDDVSDKEVSLFLLRAGIDGIQYPANYTTGKANETDFNYVVFDPRAITIKEKVQFMRTPTGTIYGFVKNGIVYINSNTPNLNTPIHEFGHLWIDAIEGSELYNRGTELVKNTPYWERVNADPNYSHLSENARVKEAMAMAIGDKGEAVKRNLALFVHIKKWINDVWKRIGAKFGIENLTPEQIQNLTFNDFVEVAVSELLSGESLTLKGQQETKLPDTIEVDGIQRPTTNSNGKPIHSTEEGIRNFWRWFGNSKVTDESGQPLVVYHGTGADFDKFNSKVFPTAGYFSKTPDIANSVAHAKTEYYNENGSVYPVYLSFTNPLNLNSINGGTKFSIDELSKVFPIELNEEIKKELSKTYKNPNPLWSYLADKKLIDYIKSNGYDGVLYKEGEVDTELNQYLEVPVNNTESLIAFYPNQIKSATGNFGSFDGENANILFEPQQLFIDFTKNETQDETRKAHGSEKKQQESVIETINNATLLPTNGAIASVSRHTSKRRSVVSSKRTVIDGFRESGYVNFNGTQVNTHQDIADLWSVHRSPYIEKTHIIFLKDGVVVGTMAHTAGKIDTAPIASVNEITDYAAQLGATQIYMLHNHPSGNPTPSLQDVKVTYHIAERLREYGISLLGQVVVDHDKYSFIDTANKPLIENLNESSLEYALQNNTEYHEYKSEKTDFLLERELVGRIDPQQWLFGYGKKLLSQPEYKAVVVYLSTDPSGKGFVVSAYDVLAENTSKEEILSIINEGLNENIGRHAVIIHDGSIKGGFGKVHAKLLDIISIQTGGFANDFVNEEVSYGEKQALWISEQQNYQYANEKRALAYKDKVKQGVKQEMLNATLSYPEYVEIDHVEEPNIIPERPVYVKGESAYEYMQKLKEYEDNLHAVDSGIKEAYQEALANTYSKTQQLKRAHIDEVSPIEQLNDFIRKQGGEINADADAYIDYFNSKGRATYFTTKFDTEYMQKLVDTFVQVRKSGELDAISAKWADTRKSLSNYEKMHVYLQAKDIEEGIALGLVDRGESGFANSIGITHTEYIAMFEDSVSKEHIDAMWKAVNDATRFSLDYQLNADMISKETYDKFTKRQYYVPQREWSERERDERPLDYVKRGGGDNPFNAALRKAKGRKSLASDPLPFIQSIAHSSILSAEKNRTKQAMLKTVKANIAIGRKAGAFDFKQSWLINSKTTDADGNMLYDVVYVLPSSELFAEDRETRKEINKLTKQMLEETDTDTIDKLNEKIEELKRNINIATFEVNDNYIRNRTSEEKKQHEVVVVSNGDRFVIQFQDEKVANAINRNFNKQTYDNVVMRALNKGARYMSAILTQYNPVFALWNFERDYQTAIISHAIDFGAEYEARFIENTSISQKAINDYVWKGKFTNSKTGKDLELFFETGAATGWSYLFRIEQLKRNLKNQIDPSVIRSIYNGTTLPFTVMAKAFSNITEVSELSTRFATFKTSIEMGYSPKEAASHAKEVTVNFDRSGSSKFFSGIFAFFNAQIQGTNKQYRQLTRTKRGKYAIPAVAFSFFIGGVINALLSPDDPDEERAWAEYDRMNNMLVGNVKIPLTHFYRTFWGMGTQAVLAYKGEKSVEVAMFDGTSNMLSDLFPQTPLSLWELLDENKATGKLEPDLRKYLQTIAPTATVPMVDVMLNKTFTGAPVAREPFTTKAKEYIPDSQLYNRNVHAFFKGATDTWFTKHGGDIAAKTKGNVPWYGDINPSKVQHIAEGYTGGVGKQLLDLTNFIYGIAKEGVFDETKIPVWNRLVKPYREDKVVAQKYWTLKNKVEYYEQSYNAYRKARAEGSSLSDEKVQQMRDSEKHQLYLEAKTKLHQMDRMMKSERVPSSQDIKELDAYIKQWNKLK